MRIQFTKLKKFMSIQMLLKNNVAKKSSTWFGSGKLKYIEFYLYTVLLCLCSLYIDIIMAMYPYLIKPFSPFSPFSHISQFKYLLGDLNSIPFFFFIIGTPLCSHYDDYWPVFLHLGRDALHNWFCSG